ncbi:TetR/AcrR family transcriptional regulator [Streptomyces profundus]|uniref:TetR/AcrR family transcriptional regulator n=1 Tax=Streptomyces profundus TaxID=2867410 RepID=UPI001D1698C4|nr:TetR/AcrR family transcriptional regulator [Streptomyces sp. MA3_2.13]UED82843.1 TetR/AcrR family transcriptional regulator [Streptomyces sp. MA3_2.13]
MSETPTRRRRADAERNRARLLAQAETVFQEQGTEASLERVARGAGVAIGTLYAHFPSRRALLLALLEDRQDAVHALGDALLADAAIPPGEALARWMTAVAAHGATYSGLAGQLLGSLDDETSALHAACHRMSTVGAALVDRARAAGVVGADVSPDDVFAVISAASWLRGQTRDEARAEHLTGLLIAGLVPG